jgi:hypothetical protein
MKVFVSFWTKRNSSNHKTRVEQALKLPKSTRKLQFWELYLTIDEIMKILLPQEFIAANSRLGASRVPERLWAVLLCYALPVPNKFLGAD